LLGLPTAKLIIAASLRKRVAHRERSLIARFSQEFGICRFPVTLLGFHTPGLRLRIYWLNWKLGPRAGASSARFETPVRARSKRLMSSNREKAELQVGDENAIRSLLARLYDAWARGDGEAYAACFAEESDYITFNGMHLHGRAENAKLHAALFRRVLRGTTLSAEIESLTLLSSGVALVHTAGSERKKSFQSYVLVKSGSDWQIRSFQNTRVQPFSVWITRWLQNRAN
jgi:uncharacterized protein (TIGR02246 family)